MTTREIIIEKLKDYQDKEHLTNVGLAQRLNVSRSTIKRYLTGQIAPDTDFIERLATLLHMSMAELFQSGSAGSVEEKCGENKRLLLDEVWSAVQRYEERKQVNTVD